MSLPTIPMRDGAMSIANLIDLYMAHYTGRDPTRTQRLSWWKQQIGALRLDEINDDHLHNALEVLATSPPCYFAGKDIHGNPIHKAKRGTIAPATINRYAASIAAVFTWAIRRRVAPKGWDHPGRRIERQAENNEKTRFLSEDERKRLLLACASAKWPRLYVLVLMALTTGARKGDLLGLHWHSIDLERAEATVAETKNGDPRVLPLVPAVVDVLRGLQAGPTVRVFGSPRDMTKPFKFEPQFQQALKNAHIRGVTFHTLRHSAASMLAANGATLLEIADVLGHRQLQMTKRYSHLATSHKAALVNRVLGDVR